jgi:hypothetical protein
MLVSLCFTPVSPLYIRFFTRLLLHLGNQLNDSANGSDLFFGQFGHKSSLDNDWNLWQSTLTQDLSVTVGQGVNDWGSR